MFEQVYERASNNNIDVVLFWNILKNNLDSNIAKSQNYCDKCSNVTIPLLMKERHYCNKCKELTLLSNAEIYTQAILIKGFTMKLWVLNAPKIYKKDKNEM